MMQPSKPLNPPSHYAIQEAAPQADISHIKNKFLDIAYADRSYSQKLDIYLPAEITAPAPVIVAIHGGAFMGGDKRDMQVLPMLEGLKLGFAVASINYRLSSESKFPALIQDAKAAIRWLRGNAAKFGLDPKRISAWGGSAGGYIASMLSLTAGRSELEDQTLGYHNQSCDIQAAVVWFGPTNFLKMDAQLAQNGLLPPPDMRHSHPNSPESLLIGAPIISVPDKVQAANPETYIGGAAPPMLFQHGRKDAVVPVQQSIEFAEKLKKAYGEERITLEILENAEHGDPAFETRENIARVFQFLKWHHIY